MSIATILIYRKEDNVGIILMLSHHGMRDFFLFLEALSLATSGLFHEVLSVSLNRSAWITFDRCLDAFFSDFFS